MVHRYKMYRTGEAWADLGIIGDRLQFTDDEIITTQGIGYTKHACKFGQYPMDAAVMFSLLSAGPDGRLNTQDLVNTQTRTATRFEQRRVALVKCVDEESPSCGHDEIDYKHRYLFPILRKQWSYQWSSENNNATEMTVMKNALNNKYVLKPSHGNKLTHVSIKNLMGSNSVAFADTKMIEKYSKVFDTYDTKEEMPWDLYWEFYNVIRDFMISKNMGNASSMLKKNEVKIYSKNYTHKPFDFWTNGTCAWPNNTKVVIGPDGSKTIKCAHHSNVTITKLVYAPGIMYENDRVRSLPKTQCNYTITLSEKDGWLDWNEHSRSIVKDVTDKEVRKLVSKSLSRLSKKGLVMRFGHGRERAFTWRGWEWLDKIQHRILNTNAKKRKVGDEVNGWRYTKHNVRQSYGMEICDYVWKPIEEFATYNIRQQYWSKNSWSHHAQQQENNVGGIFYHTKAEAESVAEQLNAIVNGNNGQSYRVVKVDSSTKKKTTKCTFYTGKSTKEFLLKGEIHPEDYMSPQKIFDMWVKAAPDVWENKKKDMVSSPTQMTSHINWLGEKA